MEKTKHNYNLPSIDECIKNNDIIHLQEWETILNNKKEKLNKKMETCHKKFHVYKHDNAWDTPSKKNIFALAGIILTIPSAISTLFINGWNIATFLTIFFATSMFGCFGVTVYYYIKNNIAMNRLYTKINNLQSERIKTITDLEKIEDIIKEKTVVKTNDITPEQFFEENKELIYSYFNQSKNSTPRKSPDKTTEEIDIDMYEVLDTESNDQEEESPKQ